MEIPCYQEQGILYQEQGISSAYQGIQRM